MKKQQLEKVYQYNRKGELIAEYESIAEAARAIDPDGSAKEQKSIATGISRAIRQGGSADGFLWARAKRRRKDFYG